MKIVNVKPIITPYTNPGPNVIHHTSLYRFDLETNVDLLEHELILHPTKLSGRTLYCSTKFQYCIEEFKQSMMHWGQHLLLNDELSKNFFGTWWWLNNDNFTDICKANAYVSKDTKGFSMGVHVDNASILANFIVNLKDNISSTTFVDYKDPGNIIYQSENKKNTGVIFFGTGGNAHSINIEDDERYVLMGSILLYKNF